MQVESFTHLPLQPRAGLVPRPQPCTRQFKLLYPLSSQEASHLRNRRHILQQASQNSLAPSWQTSPLQTSTSLLPRAMPPSWLNSRGFAHQTKRCLWAGTHLLTRLGSRHQPLWSLPCNNLQKSHSFLAQDLSRCNSLALKCLSLSPSHPLLPAIHQRNSQKPSKTQLKYHFLQEAFPD